MDVVKKRLKTILRPGAYNRPDFCWPVPDVEPQEVVTRTIELMRYHRDTLTRNWQSMDVENIQARWCCGEYPFLFRGAIDASLCPFGALTSAERWEKLFGDFCDVELEKFDPARVSEVRREYRSRGSDARAALRQPQVRLVAQSRLPRDHLRLAQAARDAQSRRLELAVLAASQARDPVDARRRH